VGAGYRHLADAYRDSGESFTAAALYRTAKALGDDSQANSLSLAESYLTIGLAEFARREIELMTAPSEGIYDIDEYAGSVFARYQRPDTWKLEYLGYGKFQRMRIIADQIAKVGSELFLICDVGGGRGEFSLFVPGHRYVLAEPSVTGIGLPRLPFSDNEFDVVVCSDVLEHVPKCDREGHILELLRVAKRRVFLTAPFGFENREFEELFFRLTRNQWTKEHLENEVTTLEEMRRFLDGEGIEFRVLPCSFAPVHFAMGILNHRELRNDKDLQNEVNEIVNSRYSGLCQREPSYGYLFELLLLP
jgi:hypothetical protein